MAWTLTSITNATAVSLLAQLVRKNLLPLWTGFNTGDIGYGAAQAAPGNVFGHVFPAAADAAAINAAVASLAGNPGTVHLLAGNWTIDAHMAIPASCQLVVEHGARLVFTPTYPEGVESTDVATSDGGGFGGGLFIDTVEDPTALWPTAAKALVWQSDAGLGDARALEIDELTSSRVTLAEALPDDFGGDLTMIGCDVAPSLSIAGPLVAPDSQWLDYPGSLITFPSNVQPKPLWWGAE
jgi:hypothetical protein